MLKSLGHRLQLKVRQMTDIRLIWFGLVVSALVSINEVNLCRARLVLGWVTMSRVQLSVPENLSQYITSHSGQLSLAIPPWVGTMSTSQKGDDALHLGSKGRYGS